MRLIRKCPECGSENHDDAKFCKNCGLNLSDIGKGSEEKVLERKTEEVSNWWWLAPIFLSIIGGLIAWFVNKDKDPKKSRRMLILGLVMLIPAGLVVALGPSEEGPVPEFEVSNLTVSPSEAEPGQTVTISVDVRNMGGGEGTKTLKLNIDGETKTKKISIAPNQKKDISFNVTREKIGAYKITISGMTKSLKVVEKGTVVSNVIKLVDNDIFYDESSHTVIIGEIKNIGDENILIDDVGFRGIWYYFYEEGEKVGSQDAKSALKVLQPGQKTPFKASTPFLEREYDSYKITEVDWVSIDDDPKKDLYEDLEIINDSGKVTNGGKTYTVVGQIKNTGNIEVADVYTSLSGTLYDSNGNVIATSGLRGLPWIDYSITNDVTTEFGPAIDYPSDGDLSHGETASFKIVFGYIQERELGDIGDYSIQVQAVLNL